MLGVLKILCDNECVCVCLCVSKCICVWEEKRGRTIFCMQALSFSFFDVGLLELINFSWRKERFYPCSAAEAKVAGKLCACVH